MAFDNGYLQGNTFQAGSDWITVGVYIQFDTTLPGVGFDFFRVSQDASGEYHLALRLHPTGIGEKRRLQLRDSATSEVYLSEPELLQADRWYLFELKFKQSNSSDYYLWMDGVLLSSGSGEDFDFGGIHARMEVRTQNNLTGGTPPLTTVYCGSWYVRTDDGANIDTNDTRVGPYTVMGPFNWSASGVAGDFGTNLNSGNWDNLKEVPLSTANTAGYISAVNGGVSAHDGALPGPKGNESLFDGTILGAKWFWQYRRVGGFGSHTGKFKYGANSDETVDNTVDSATKTITTSWQDLWIMEDDSGANVPTKEEYFQMGFERTSGAGGEHYVSEMWPFIFHQEQPHVFGDNIVERPKPRKCVSLGF